MSKVYKPTVVGIVKAISSVPYVAQSHREKIIAGILSYLKSVEEESEDGIFDLVEGFLKVDHNDLKTFTKAVDKILPEIDKIMYRRRKAAAKVRHQVLN